MRGSRLNRCHSPTMQYLPKPQRPILGLRGVEPKRTLKSRGWDLDRFIALARKITILGLSVDECCGFGEDFTSEKFSEDFYSFLRLVQDKLIEAEYSNGLPQPHPWLLFHRAHRTSNKTALVFQRSDGSYPIPKEPCFNP